jgi:hypothetical protein
MQAVQILGGMGFMRGTVSERIYREVKVMMIGGGAEEIMKELAAKQTGLVSPPRTDLYSGPAGTPLRSGCPTVQHLC